jgi:hypothetical protein
MAKKRLRASPSFCPSACGMASFPAARGSKFS